MNTSVSGMAVLLAGLLLAPGPGWAGVGDLDVGFGAAGFAGNAVGALPDGRLISHVTDSNIGTTGARVYSGPTQFRRTDINGQPESTFVTVGPLSPVNNFQIGFGATARTADGKWLIGGTLLPDQPAILRLDASGNIDPTFGNAGLVAAPYASARVVRRLAVQPDGRVLALVENSGSLTVAAVRRFNVDGSVDQSFGAGNGIAVLPTLPGCNVCYGSMVVFAGGFIRVWDDYGDFDVPQVFLNSSGMVVASPAAPADLPASANGWQVASALATGAQLLAGTVGAAGADFALARLRADGSLDRSFGGGGTGYVTFDFGQLALGQSGLFPFGYGPEGPKVSVNAAGSHMYVVVLLNSAGQSALVVARLLVDASGRVTLDQSFGSSGVTLLAHSVPFYIQDIAEQPGGDVVLTTWGAGSAFRLFGSPARSAGAVGMRGGFVSASETSGNLVVRVARTAGKDGPVSLDYTTRDRAAGAVPAAAAAGSDYIATSGRLDWADGDTADKLITIPVINDSVAESTESFDIVLGNVTGGAILVGNSSFSASIVNVGGSASATASATTSATAPATAAAQGGGGSFDGLALGLALLCMASGCLRRYGVSPALRRRAAISWEATAMMTSLVSWVFPVDCTL